MDQTVAKISSPALKLFDEELKTALAPIARFAGLETLPLVVKSSEFKRSTAAVNIDFLVTTDFRTQRFAGHPANANHIPIVNNPQALVKEKADARFREALDASSLRGVLREGVVGKGAQIVCDEAYALSRSNCGCGDGTVDCRGCSTTGRMTCRNCEFSFSAGAGKVTCYGCHGQKGSRDVEGKWYNCGTCGGHGTIWCGWCGGSQQRTCESCGGHGVHTCRTCAGNGFFTDAYFFKMEMTPVIGSVATKLPPHATECVKEWIASGLKAHAADKTNSVLPWSDFQTAKASYPGWKDGVYRATLPVSCEVTHADLEAEYSGSPSAVSYVRIHEPRFTFPNFLDYELVRIAAKTDRLAAGRPSAFLREISNVKGLTGGLRDFVSTNSWREYWVNETAAKMKGAVSSKYLDRIARDYQTSLLRFERNAVAQSLFTMTPLVSAFAAVLWYFGMFGWLMDFTRDTRVVLFFLTGLFFAVVMNYAVRYSTRRKVEYEVNGISLLTLGLPGRLGCFAVGLLIAHVGLWTSAVYQ
ncbi:hypothetical protein ACC668_17545 [Rhizobium ruizarguesonis]